MRLYRVVLRSGANMDITAKAMRDDPALDVIYFFHDEAQNVLAASIQRSELAGLILHPRNSSAIPHH
jgi:hypothetical protein